MTKLAGVLVPLLVVIIPACAQPPEGTGTAEGVVVAVEGDLTEVVSFTLVTSDEERLEFVPDPEAGNPDFPLMHLSEHLRSGDPVEVRYEERDGILWATWVEDNR